MMAVNSSARAGSHHNTTCQCGHPSWCGCTARRAYQTMPASRASRTAPSHMPAIYACASLGLQPFHFGFSQTLPSAWHMRWYCDGAVSVTKRDASPRYSAKSSSPRTCAIISDRRTRGFDGLASTHTDSCTCSPSSATATMLSSICRVSVLRRFTCASNSSLTYRPARADTRPLTIWANSRACAHALRAARRHAASHARRCSTPAAVRCAVSSGGGRPQRCQWSRPAARRARSSSASAISRPASCARQRAQLHTSRSNRIECSRAARSIPAGTGLARSCSCERWRQASTQGATGTPCTASTCAARARKPSSCSRYARARP